MFHFSVYAKRMQNVGFVDSATICHFNAYHTRDDMLLKDDDHFGGPGRAISLRCVCVCVSRQ